MIYDWILGLKNSKRHFGNNYVNLNMDFLFDMVTVSMLTFLGENDIMVV